MNNEAEMKSKEWYMAAVESCLILRGLTRQEAKSFMERYKLSERIDKYPEVQLHYDVDATVDEILAG